MHAPFVLLAENALPALFISVITTILVSSFGCIKRIVTRICPCFGPSLHVHVSGDIRNRVELATVSEPKSGCDVVSRLEESLTFISSLHTLLDDDEKRKSLETKEMKMSNLNKSKSKSKSKSKCKTKSKSKEEEEEEKPVKTLEFLLLSEAEMGSLVDRIREGSSDLLHIGTLLEAIRSFSCPLDSRTEENAPSSTVVDGMSVEKGSELVNVNLEAENEKKMFEEPLFVDIEEYSALVQERSDLLERITRLQRELDEMSALKSNSEASIASLRDSLLSSESKVASCQDQLAVLIEEKTRFETEVSNLLIQLTEFEDRKKKSEEALHASLSEQICALEATREENHRLIGDLESAMKEKDAQIELLASSAISSEQEKCQNLFKRISDLEATREENYRSIQHLESVIKEKNMEIEQLSSRAGGCEEERCRLENELSLLSLSFSAIQDEFSALQSRIECMKIDHDQKLETISQLELNINACKQEKESLSNQLTSACSERDILETELQNAFDSLACCEQVRDHYKTYISHLQNDITRLESTLQAIHDEKKTMTEKVSALEEENASLRSSLSELESQHSVTSASLATSEESCRALQSRMEDVSEERASLTERISVLEEENASLRSSLSELESQHSATSASLATSEESCRALQSRIRELEREKMDGLDKISVLEKERDDLQSSHLLSQQVMTEVHAELSSKKIECEGYEAKIFELTSKISSLEVSTDEIAERSISLESENSRLRAENHELKSSLESACSEKENLTLSLDSFKIDLANCREKMTIEENRNFSLSESVCFNEEKLAAVLVENHQLRLQLNAFEEERDAHTSLEFVEFEPLNESEYNKVFSDDPEPFSPQNSEPSSSIRPMLSKGSNPVSVQSKIMEEFSLFNQKKLTIIAKYSGGSIQVRVGGGTKNIQEYLKSFREKVRLGVFKKSSPLSSSPSSPRRLSDLGSPSRSSLTMDQIDAFTSALEREMMAFSTSPDMTNFVTFHIKMNKVTGAISLTPIKQKSGIQL